LRFIIPFVVRPSNHERIYYTVAREREASGFDSHEIN
jgi:hypothetical protein